MRALAHKVTHRIFSGTKTRTFVLPLTSFGFICTNATAEPAVVGDAWWHNYQAEKPIAPHHKDNTGNPRFINSLIEAETPYLVNHSLNPVNWRSWDGLTGLAPELKNKPIFISIGYSSCHWCHVMERESFENLEIAEFINQHFVPVLIDREQHPALDHSYMTAAELTLGQGGWPLTVFALPDGTPFFLDLYQPPEAFLETLKRVEEGWRLQRTEINTYAARIKEAVGIVQEPQNQLEAIEPGLFQEFRSSFTANADFAFGGFGQSNKFPQEVLLSNLITALKDGQDDEEHQEFLLLTLKMMANGGLYDHLGGGFFRYTVDPAWTTPHFEKMLYNQANLITVFSEAYALTGIHRFMEVAIETADSLLRDFRGENQLLFSAYDADSEGIEGLFYLWKPEDIKHLTKEEQELARVVFGVDEDYELPEGNNLIKEDVEDVLSELKIDEIQFEVRLADLKQRLFDLRSLRTAPFLDKKALTSWNAMAIRALLEAGKLLQRDTYIIAAKAALDSLWAIHYDEEAKELSRFSLEGSVGTTKANLDDYAFLALAYLSLYDFTQNSLYLERADVLSQRITELFWDEESETFYLEAAGANSGNFVKARVLTDRAVPR